MGVRIGIGHRSLACSRRFGSYARQRRLGQGKAMLRAWFEHANSGGGVARYRVKVDYPVISY